MSTWISVEKAAVKYGFNKEVIILWAEMKRFPVGYGEPSPVIDERSFQEFIAQMKKGDYVRIYRYIRRTMYSENEDLRFVCRNHWRSR